LRFSRNFHFVQFTTLAKGIDIDIFDNNGKTPLMWAVSHTEELDIIRVLISLGADPNLADRGLGHVNFFKLLNKKKFQNHKIFQYS